MREYCIETRYIGYIIDTLYVDCVRPYMDYASVWDFPLLSDRLVVLMYSSL